MLMHVHVADAPRRAPSSMTPRRPPETDGGLLTILGPVEHEWHIVVVGNMGLDLMCTLLRAGAPRVAHLCLHERLQAEDTSLVIVPRLPWLEWLDAALPQHSARDDHERGLAALVDLLPTTRSASSKC